MFTPAEHLTLCLVIAFFVNMHHAAPPVLLEYLARFLCALFFSFTTRDLTRHYLRDEYDFNYLLEALYASPLLLAAAGPDRCPLRALACWSACRLGSVLVYACARQALRALTARLCKRPCVSANVHAEPDDSHAEDDDDHDSSHTHAPAVMSLPDQEYCNNIQPAHVIECQKYKTQQLYQGNNFDLFYNRPVDRPDYFRKYYGECIVELKAFVSAHITTFGVHQFEYVHHEDKRKYNFVLYVPNVAAKVREIKVFDLQNGPNAPRCVCSMYVVGACAGVQYVFP